MIKQAVILAAGHGKRLGSYSENKPKGFIKLGDSTIIQESIEKLISHGIETIWIVTGFASEYYEHLSLEYPDIITTVKNELYDKSGTLHSLSKVNGLIKQPFLLLESDIIYESRALDAVISHRGKNCILLSGFTYSGDEVFVEARTGQLVSMSKNKEELSSEPIGELVGISKIDHSLFKKMMEIGKGLFKQSLQVDYETDALVGSVKDIIIDCILLDDLLWAEIDDITHLKRAKEMIYPKIYQREKEDLL